MSPNRSFKPKELCKAFAVVISLTASTTANAQVLIDRASILESIKQSFEWRGEIKAFKQNPDAKMCRNLMATFVPIIGQVSRFDFTLHELGSSSNEPKVACVEIYADGTRSFEYFPSSVFAEENQSG